jgi:hypothetical protein
MEYNQHVYHFNPNRPLYSIDDLDMALVLSHTGDFDPSNPARIQLLQPNPDSEGGAEEEEEGLSDHFKDRYMAWLEEEVSSIDKAPNDTGFLGRCSLIKSVQSVWHVT